jgi:hypothetical protein
MPTCSCVHLWMMAGRMTAARRHGPRYATFACTASGGRWAARGPLRGCGCVLGPFHAICGGRSGSVGRQTGRNPMTPMVLRGCRVGRSNGPGWVRGHLGPGARLAASCAIGAGIGGFGREKPGWGAAGQPHPVAGPTDRGRQTLGGPACEGEAVHTPALGGCPAKAQPNRAGPGSARRRGWGVGNKNGRSALTDTLRPLRRP